MNTQHTVTSPHTAFGIEPTALPTSDSATVFNPFRAVRSLAASLSDRMERRRTAAHWSRSHRSRRNRPPTRSHLRAQWEAELRGF
jgi:hypothetical protein